MASSSASSATCGAEKSSEEREADTGSTAASASERKLVGHAAFSLNRVNPRSDRFAIEKFHHIEFYTSDASNTSRRFTWGLGMPCVAKSDLSTGNHSYASYVLKSNELVFVFTAPYCNSAAASSSSPPHPGFEQEAAHAFVRQHGLAVRAVGIVVASAEEAYSASIAGGAEGVLPPTKLLDAATGTWTMISEMKLFGDVVIRWMSGEFVTSKHGPFLPNYEPLACPALSYGLERLDHCVSNVPKLFDAVDSLVASTGMHEFSEFSAEDVGTIDSGLNSMVLANNDESVLLPINEPTFGTRRKSQIQTYLEHNNGAGVQHLALLTSDIFRTMKEMKMRSSIGGFEFMPAPGSAYYAKVPDRIGANTLTARQLEELQELGLLADRDDQGVLLQVFTKPLGDRPTVFIEIIQRIGCDMTPEGKPKEQTAGCGGFGKGNFSELFKSIEEFEKGMEMQAPPPPPQQQEEAGAV